MTAARAPAMTSKERTALSRARKRDGILLADDVEIAACVAEKLIAAGWASPEEIADKKQLSSVLTDFLDCWGRGTLDPPL